MNSLPALVSAIEPTPPIRQQPLQHLLEFPVLGSVPAYKDLMVRAILLMLQALQWISGGSLKRHLESSNSHLPECLMQKVYSEGSCRKQARKSPHTESIVGAQCPLIKTSPTNTNLDLFASVARMTFFTQISSKLVLLSLLLEM